MSGQPMPPARCEELKAEWRYLKREWERVHRTSVGQTPDDPRMSVGRSPE